MKASAVPIATPALVNSLTSGMTPAAFEYNGMPKYVIIIFQEKQA